MIIIMSSFLHIQQSAVVHLVSEEEIVHMEHFFYQSRQFTENLWEM